MNTVQAFHVATLGIEGKKGTFYFLVSTREIGSRMNTVQAFPVATLGIEAGR